MSGGQHLGGCDRWLAHRTRVFSPSVCGTELPGRLWALLAVGVALTIAVGCSGEDGPRATVPAQRIIDTPQSYFGKEVTIEAEVSKQIDHRVWEMANGRLLAISDRGIDPAPRRGELLRVRGAVHPLERGRIENELGVNIEDYFFEDPFLADDVAIVAEDVSRLG